MMLNNERRLWLFKVMRFKIVGERTSIFILVKVFVVVWIDWVESWNGYRIVWSEVHNRVGRGWGVSGVGWDEWCSAEYNDVNGSTTLQELFNDANLWYSTNNPRIYSRCLGVRSEERGVMNFWNIFLYL